MTEILFTDQEQQVLIELAKEQQLTEKQVIRQALRLYQLVHEKAKAGHPMRFEGEEVYGCGVGE